MSIDPNNFEPQGMPTPEQAREVWEQLGRPGHRKVHAELVRRGYKLADRTVARWKELGAWGGDEAAPGSAKLADKGKVRGVKKAIARELLGVPAETIQQADAMATNGIQRTIAADVCGKTAGARAQEAVQDEVMVIDRRIAMLVEKTEAELDVIEQKSRKILNIVLTEAAARRAHVMVLIPKDTGNFVEAMTEASKQTLTGGIDQVPKKGDPRVIEGDVIDVEPENPLASEINKFLHDEGISG